MSGIPKARLEYAGWATDIFDNESSPFDELLNAQGWVGFGVFFFLCQRAYSTDGYFYRWSFKNAASTARKMGGGVKTETVKQVVSLCLQIGLFDNRLFDREGILTNKMIQERYMAAIEKRSQNGRTVNGKYWLLKKEETKAYIVIPEKDHSLPEDVGSLPENATKYSKVKDSKVNVSKSSVETAENETETTYGQHIRLKPSEYSELCGKYGEKVISDYIGRIDQYITIHNIKPYPNHYRTIVDWLRKDNVKEQSVPSYDLDELIQHELDKLKE